MTTYLALLRGINVGGHSLVKMEELRAALAEARFVSPRTYIQSGNVLFESDCPDHSALREQLESCLLARFGLPIGAALFTAQQWQEALATAPDWWGREASWKHNLLVPLDPAQTAEVLQALADRKPERELVLAGQGVVYQSLNSEKPGQASTSRLASKPIYRQLTIRNRSTCQKLQELLTLKTP